VRIVGVIDLRRGRAVHARGGHRDRYEAVQRVAGGSIDGDPVALARAYRGAGVHELYVADLDAIAGGALQADIIASLAEGDPLLLDAGVSSRPAAERAGGVARGVVVGLETLTSWQALASIADGIGRTRTVFSLDLRGDVPLGRLVSEDPLPVPAIAARAVDAGAGSVLVIDVSQVGMSTGPALDRLRAIRAAIPGVPLLAGGGVRDDADLARLADCGCDGALVATALHEGRIHVRT
jgi:phosphoribosylformimino-5-aminoimidazole carboxamide ribotide isomerase